MRNYTLVLSTTLIAALACMAARWKWRTRINCVSVVFAQHFVFFVTLAFLQEDSPRVSHF